MVMPASVAASRIVTLSSALTCFPSIVKVLAAIEISVAGFGFGRGGGGLLRAPVAVRPVGILLEQLRVFAPEEAQRAQHRVGRGLAETTKARVLHHVAKLLKLLQVARGGFARQDLRQQTVHLHRAGAAGNALAARFVHAELHEEARDIHHLRGVIHDDHADRKSTRLNSSHLVISYAVFCLKKKTTNTPSALARIAGLRSMQAYTRQDGLGGISLMPTNLYGPGFFF